MGSRSASQNWMICATIRVVGTPVSRAESAFSAALEPNGTTELTIAATVNDIQVNE